LAAASRVLLADLENAALATRAAADVRRGPDANLVGAASAAVSALALVADLVGVVRIGRGRADRVAALLAIRPAFKRAGTTAIVAEATGIGGRAQALVGPAQIALVV